MSASTLVPLPDGRVLCMEETGDPTGRPVLLLHGGGHSRLFRHPDAQLTARLGVRLITVDRPGIGRSTLDPGRTIAGWGRDAAALTETLGLDRLHVIGHSMGGPFAVAAAAALGDRVTHLTIAGGLPPLDDPAVFGQLDAFNQRLYRLARRLPWALRPLLGTMVARRRRDPVAFHDRYYAEAPPADRAAAADAALGAVLRDSAGEAVTAGVRGLAQEIEMVARPWDIDPAQVTAPAQLVYGDQDHVVGDAAPPAYRRLFPEAALRVLPGAGHLTPLTHREEVLGD